MPLSTARGSTAHGSTARGYTARDSAARDSTARGSTARESTARAARDSTVRESTARGSTARDPTARDSTARGSTAGGEPMDIIIWGETGEGKSTLINVLCGAQVAEAGRNPAGVTKEIKSYDCTVNGCAVRLWDLPGAGDKDVPAYRTMEALAIAFQNKKVAGLLLLSSRSDRMPLGAQLVAKMMEMSFTTRDKWASVVLVGTKNDKYEKDRSGSIQEEVNHFKTACLAEFNRTVGGNIKKVCTCNHKDITEVKSMITSLRTERGMGAYQQPDPARVATALCDLNGLPKGAARDKEMAKIIGQIKQDRKQLQEALKRQQEESRRRERDHRRAVDEMRDQHQRQAQDMRRLMDQARRDGEDRERRLQKELEQARVQQRSGGGFKISLGPFSFGF